MVLRPNELLRLSEKSQHVQKMFDKIADRYDLLNRLLSARQDVRWRKALAKSLPAQADKCGVLYDVACGTGDVILTVAKMRSDYSQIRGFDISFEMLRRGEVRPDVGKWLRKSSINCTYTQASAEALPVENESSTVLCSSPKTSGTNRKTASMITIAATSPPFRM